MRVTRRFWAIVGLAVVSTGTAVFYGQSLLLIGGVSLWAWLIAAQYAFVSGLTRLADSLSVEQSVMPDIGRPSDEFTATLSVRSAQPAALRCAVSLRPPPSARKFETTDGTCQLEPGTAGADVTATFQIPFAGQVEFPSPTLRVVDRLGLFEESYELVDVEHAQVTVEPAAPSNIHVGRGGQTAAVYGEHPAESQGPGFDPNEIREYVWGDPASQIDWKTTARMGYPHVVEHESRTDVQTVLIVDSRPEMSVGLSGRTKLDYNRKVALSILVAVIKATDPIGLYTVDTDSVMEGYEPSASADHQRRIRSRLLELSASATASARPPNDVRRSTTQNTAEVVIGRASDYLRADESAFATALRPFLLSQRSTDERSPLTAADPLFTVVNTLLTQERGNLALVIFSDDSRPEQLRQTVRLAQNRDVEVTLFLTPSVLFETDALANPEAAFERYRSFEALRSDLDRLQRTQAYEVAPRDRLQTVLAAGRRATGYSGEDRTPEAGEDQ